MHAQFSYNDRSIVVVNSKRDAIQETHRLSACVRLQSQGVLFAPFQAQCGPGQFNERHDPSAVPVRACIDCLFCKTHGSGRGKKRSQFQLLLAAGETLDHGLGQGERHRLRSHRDLRRSDSPAATSARSFGVATAKAEGTDQVRVTIHNPTKNLAFQVHLGIRGANSEEEILPVLWEDNYISLLPRRIKIAHSALSEERCARKEPNIGCGWVECGGGNHSGEFGPQRQAKRKNDPEARNYFGFVAGATSAFLVGVAFFAGAISTLTAGT